MIKCNQKMICCDFNKDVLFNDQQPLGFQEWCENITHDKCKIILPDKTSYDIRMFVDLNDVFNNASYTKFLVNRFKELNNE